MQKTILKPNIPKTVLVTGAARRIGKAIATYLAADGFAIAVHTNESVAEAQQTVNEIRQKGGRAILVEADLTQSQSTADLISKANRELGAIGILVNNASVFKNDSAQEFNSEIFDEHFAVHVRAPSILAAELIKQLPDEASGLIVNIIDQRVWALTPRFYSYTLSKSALWTATQTMAQSFAPRVRVNAIGPGPSIRSARQSIEDFNKQIDGTILKRGPMTDEFGRTVRYFYDSPSVTGQMVALDGGQHLGWETPDIAEISE